FWCMSKFAGRPVRTWALTLLLAPQLFAEGPTIRIPRIEVAPTLSDFSDMETNARFAGKMLKVTGFIVRDPADGAQPTQNTEVYLGYDQHNLYAVFVCWDTEPGKIRARMTRREDIFSDDSAEIMIDTFHDARSPYASDRNPHILQRDAPAMHRPIVAGRRHDAYCLGS